MLYDTAHKCNIPFTPSSSSLYRIFLFVSLARSRPLRARAIKEQTSPCKARFWNLFGVFSSSRRKKFMYTLKIKKKIIISRLFLPKIYIGKRLEWWETVGLGAHFWSEREIELNKMWLLVMRLQFFEFCLHRNYRIRLFSWVRPRCAGLCIRFGRTLLFTTTHCYFGLQFCLFWSKIVKKSSKFDKFLKNCDQIVQKDILQILDSFLNHKYNLTVKNDLNLTFRGVWNYALSLVEFVWDKNYWDLLIFTRTAYGSHIAVEQLCENCRIEAARLGNIYHYFSLLLFFHCFSPDQVAKLGRDGRTADIRQSHDDHEWTILCYLNESSSWAKSGQISKISHDYTKS